MTIIDNMGAKLHICCGIKEEKPNYFAHDLHNPKRFVQICKRYPIKML